MPVKGKALSNKQLRLMEKGVDIGLDKYVLTCATVMVLSS